MRPCTVISIGAPTSIDPELVEAAGRSRRTMTRHLEALAAAGIFRGDAGLVGHMYWAALHGAIMLAFCGKLQPPNDARRLIPALFETLGKGLFNPPPRGKVAKRDAG